MATLGVSCPPFSQPRGQAKCWDMQFCPMEKDRLGQGCAPDCCCCELAPSVSGKVFQQSSEDLLAQPFCAAGQFPSVARAPVSQLEWQLTLLMLHQRHPGSLSFFPGYVPQKCTAGGMQSLVLGCRMLISEAVAGMVAGIVAGIVAGSVEAPQLLLGVVAGL